MIFALAVIVLTGFHSPSGNIKCVAVPGAPPVLRCTIDHSDYATKLQAQCIKPDGSGVDWHGFELTATGKAAVTCSGGLLIAQKVAYVNLPYGKSYRKLGFTCTSRFTGVTCRNRAGHTLFVSRQSYRLP
jgi:hypothetical protein